MLFGACVVLIHHKAMPVVLDKAMPVTYLGKTTNIDVKAVDWLAPVGTPLFYCHGRTPFYNDIFFMWWDECLLTLSGTSYQFSPGRGTGAQIGSRLFHVILVFSENARKTWNLPKLVDQLPSAAPSFNCKLHRFNMREKTRILCRQSRLNPPTRTQSLKMSTPEFQKMQASARATRSFR